MKYSIIFDKLNKCKGCENEYSKPEKIVIPGGPCEYCERNSALLHTIVDRYIKRKKDPELDLSKVEDDTQPVKNDNNDYLASEWGIKPNQKRGKK